MKSIRKNLGKEVNHLLGLVNQPQSQSGDEGLE